jgi:AcrR family transcriptional regulator
MTLEERRQREKDLRRENAVSAASKLFSSKGYERVTMDEVANEAELSKTTLYSYFKDKESLLLAIVIRGSKIFRSILIEEEERMQKAAIKFGASRNAWERFVLEYPEYAQCRVYFRTGKFDLLNDQEKNEDAKQILESTKYFFEKGVSEINSGMENGILRSDINPDVVIALYIMLNDNMFAISPDLREVLNSKGITDHQLFHEVLHLLSNIVLNQENLE